MIGFNDRESGPVNDTAPASGPSVSGPSVSGPSVSGPSSSPEEQHGYRGARLPPPPYNPTTQGISPSERGMPRQQQAARDTPETPTGGESPDEQRKMERGGGQRGSRRDRFLAAFAENLQEAGVPQEKIQDVIRALAQIHQLPQEQRKQAFAQMFPDQQERAVIGRALQATRQELGISRQGRGTDRRQQPPPQQQE